MVFNEDWVVWKSSGLSDLWGLLCPPLQYSSAGCLLNLHHSEKPEHEEVCEFRPYTCPCPGATCKWHGSLEAVMPHLMHAHKSITTLQVSTTVPPSLRGLRRSSSVSRCATPLHQGEDIVFLATDINLPGAVDWVMMQSCFNHHFMLVLEKQEKYEGHQQFFAVVLLIGTRKQGENFAYRLELNGNRRRLTWEATPRSIHDGVAAAIMNSDCLVFDTSIAHLFADNGNLGINVTISMCWGSTSRQKTDVMEEMQHKAAWIFPVPPPQRWCPQSYGIRCWYKHQGLPKTPRATAEADPGFLLTFGPTVDPVGLLKSPRFIKDGCSGASTLISRVCNSHHVSHNLQLQSGICKQSGQNKPLRKQLKLWSSSSLRLASSTRRGKMCGRLLVEI